MERQLDRRVSCELELRAPRSVCESDRHVVTDGEHCIPVPRRFRFCSGEAELYGGGAEGDPNPLLFARADLVCHATHGAADEMRSERVPGLTAEGALVSPCNDQTVLPGDRDETPAATLARVLACFAQAELVVEERVRRLTQSQLEDEGMSSLDLFLAQEAQAHARRERDSGIIICGRVQTHPQDLVDRVGPTGRVVLAETGRMTQLVRQSIDDRDPFPRVQVDFDRRRRLRDSERLFQEGPLSLSVLFDNREQRLLRFFIPSRMLRSESYGLLASQK